MRVAVITDEIDQDLDHALDVMAEYGVKIAELRGIWDTNIVEASDSLLDRAEASLKAHDVSVVSIASPFYKCDLTDDKSLSEPNGPLHSATAMGLSAQIDILNRAVVIAKRFKAPYIRAFTFWRRGSLTPELEDQIVQAFAEPAEIAGDAGVVLIVENEHSCTMGTGAETARLLAKINSPVVRACWDPGNAFYAGESPFPAGYESIKPFVEHVHVKDAILGSDGQPTWTVVGKGACRWPEQIDALAKSGYNGVLSLETHYGGAGTKEASSRECLAQLVQLAS